MSVKMEKHLKKILVIDDEAGIRILLFEQLSSAGYEVVTASDGDEGIEKINNQYFDMVISDLMMPKVSGIEVMKTLKKSNTKTKMMIMSGAGIEYVKEKMKEGIFDVIAKPFDLDKMLTMIDTALLKE
ncbi:MAG: hypothetical protein A2536_09415 [Candidatus Firestonebacteria bacterium RIFOXYD2_FULL_39_29]|nr:MAG: hypothetical protein A2536_09415 [Candidatus Firestonebacteria bacterium RIFOXYD2_FULL_39_29]